MPITECQNNEVVFSFIIPVYNVERYLEQCVTSILSQDFSNFEIILVDDGSTDSSGLLCDHFAQSDQRIRVIHQKNGGSSEARNTGIRNVCGEYVLFVDADDYIEPGSVGLIYEEICLHPGVDVVFLEATKVYPDGRQRPMHDGYVKSRIEGRSYEDVLEHLSALPKSPGSACTKAIKRSLLDETLLFEKGLYSEDLEWVYRLFAKAKTYTYIDTPYYYYRQSRHGSNTDGFSKKKFDSTVWIIKKWAQKKPENPYRETINALVAFQYMIWLSSLASAPVKDAKQYFKYAAQIKWILKYGKSKKLRMVHLVCNVLGVRLTAKLLRAYRKGILS